MIWLVLTLLLLLVLALIALLSARAASRRAGLPHGKLLYGDTGFPVGHIAPLTVDEEGTKQERPLLSEKYGLVGRPDYLVRTRAGIIPIEAKSSKAPASGRPYTSHLMQLAAYCLLVEEATGAEVPYGLIRYRDREIEVEFTPELREEVLTILEEVREAQAAPDVHRSHNDLRRCAGCSMREICDEAL